MRKFVLLAAIAATPAFADNSGNGNPFNNFDVNSAVGTLTFDVSSLAVAGALIQGTEAGSVSAEIEAFNTASALGEMEFDFSNGSNFGLELSGEFSTAIDGAASAAVDGVGDITVVAGTFGSAQTGFATEFDLAWD